MATDSTINDNLFDEDYYLGQNPDVAASGIDARTHYEQHGAAEGRSPIAGFDASYYSDANADVAASGIDPFVHFVRHGAAEGRAPSQGSSVEQFYQANPGAQSFIEAQADVQNSIVIPAGSQGDIGIGIDGLQGFDATYYSAANPDVAASGIDPFLHFLAFGAAEGRAPAAGITADQFFQMNAGLQAGGTGAQFGGQNDVEMGVLVPSGAQTTAWQADGGFGAPQHVAYAPTGNMNDDGLFGHEDWLDDFF